MASLEGVVSRRPYRLVRRLFAHYRAFGVPLLTGHRDGQGAQLVQVGSTDVRR
jgi:hypothetical protein